MNSIKIIYLFVMIVFFSPYQNMNQQANEESVNILVTYYSMTGNTENYAKIVANGAESVPGAKVVIKAIADISKEDLSSADGIIVGSPVYWVNISGEVTKFFNDVAFKYQVSLKDKVGGAFSTGAEQTGGSQLVIISILTAMLSHRMIIVGPAYELYGVIGASAIVKSNEKEFDESELNEARLLGNRVAQIAKKIKSQSAPIQN